jgi:PAS domain S-box-containing protein
VIVTDVKGQVTLLNPVAEQLTGWPADAARGNGWMSVLRLVQADTQAARDNLAARARSTGGCVSLGSSCLLVARDGRRLHAEGTVTAVSDPEGAFLGWVILFRDVTPRRRMEEALRLFEEQLRRWGQVESVGRLAAGMAHDFNQFLTVIQANLTLALATIAPGDPSHEGLARADRATAQAVEVVKQLVGFTRRPKRRWEYVQLNTIVADIVEFVRGLLEPGITIEFTPGEDLWSIQADREQLKEVVLNLCLNARDAMPQGGRLSIQTENVLLGPGSDQGYSGKGRAYVCLRISDTGQGMSAEVQAHLAEPFFTTKESRKGLGLGLALVYATVEQHGGWVDCQSELGQGTRFDIYLPRHGIPGNRGQQGTTNGASQAEPNHRIWASGASA